MPTAPRLIDFEQQEDGPTLGTTEVSEITGVCPRLVRELVEAGDIRGTRLGRSYKVPWRSLRVYLYRIGMLPMTPAERNGGATTRASGASCAIRT